MDLKKKTLNLFTLILVRIFKLKYDLIIFSHVPQCGGNSILHIFKFFIGYRFLIIHGRETDFYIKNPKILKKRMQDKILVLGHFGFDFVNFLKKIYKKQRIYLLFSFRNPRQRYLSNYYRNKKQGNFNYTLIDFLKIIKKKKLDNIFTRYLSGKKIYNDKNNQVVNKKIITISNKNLNKFNDCIILDQLNNHMSRVIKKLFHFNIIFRLIKFHKNKVSNSKYKKISIEEENILDQLTKIDYNIYNNLKKKNE